MSKLIPFRNIAQTGIIKDIRPHNLSVEAWSNGGNVRFFEGAIHKFLGYQQVYTTSPPSVPAYYLLPVPTLTNYIWLVFGLDDIWKIDGGVWTNITRLSGIYTGTKTDLWTGTVLGGIVLCSNGVDDPQMWDPATANLVSLKWDGSDTWATKSITCKALRSFNNFSIALNVIKSGIQDPWMVKWSTGALAGNPPASWDEADPTVDAGEFSLVKGGDFVVDFLQMGDMGIVYKERSTYSMVETGHPYIFRFRKLPFNEGILGINCAVEWNGIHIVKTGDNFIVHNGRSIVKYITNTKWKREIVNTIDASNFKNSYVVLNKSFNETWFCYPESGATFPTLALVWNMETDALGIRELPEATIIQPGIVDPDVSDTIGDLVGTWDDLSGPWDAIFYKPMTENLLMGADTTGVMSLYQMDVTNQNAGNDINFFVERIGLAVTGIDKQGKFVINPSKIKLCTRVYPIIDGVIDEIITIKVGRQKHKKDSVEWVNTKSFIIGTDEYIDCEVSGRYLALHFESLEGTVVEITGYDLELEEIGEN
jgi:hypothetical protein